MDVSYNRIGSDGVVYILLALKSNLSYLWYLNISVNGWGDGVGGFFDAVLDKLQKNGFSEEEIELVKRKLIFIRRDAIKPSQDPGFYQAWLNGPGRYLQDPAIKQVHDDYYTQVNPPKINWAAMSEKLILFLLTGGIGRLFRTVWKNSKDINQAHDKIRRLEKKNN